MGGIGMMVEGCGIVEYMSLNFFLRLFFWSHNWWSSEPNSDYDQILLLEILRDITGSGFKILVGHGKANTLSSSISLTL